MSELSTPRVADPAPRSAMLARAIGRPRPGLPTAVLCAFALAAAGIHSVLGPDVLPATAGDRPAPADVRGVPAAPAPAPVATAIALRR